MGNNMLSFYGQLNADKIKITWNKNPIKMSLFLSFLTVETHKETEFLGCLTGWTQYTGGNNLQITGGVVGGVEYLDHILYGKNLANPYNNFVNPFYLFPIMNDAGKAFFLDYYSAEIQALKAKAKERVKIAAINLATAKEDKLSLDNFWRSHGVK